jgi:hypothetical protein
MNVVTYIIPLSIRRSMRGTGKGRYHRVTFVDSTFSFRYRPMRFWEVGWMHLRSGCRWPGDTVCEFIFLNLCNVRFKRRSSKTR